MNMNSGKNNYDFIDHYTNKKFTVWGFAKFSHCMSFDNDINNRLLVTASKFKLPFFLLILYTFLGCLPVRGQQLHLRLAGNEQQGFHVDIYDGNQLRVTNTGEFSLQLFNTDLSTTAKVTEWRGEKWTGNDTLITLTKDSYVKEFDANLSVTVSYEVVNGNTIKKTIRLFQPSMPDMYYILDEKAIPAEKPLRYTTFEYDDFPGGLVHEMFPAAGWITPDNKVVGFLTVYPYHPSPFQRTGRRICRNEKIA
jgi:hypothetical protein